MSQYKTVAELLEAPERWTQGVPARSKSGASAFVGNPDACSWCVLGAIWLLYDNIDAVEAERKFRSANGIESIGNFNDSRERTHAEVLAAVRKAGI